VVLKDSPLRDRAVRLEIRKRRFWCKQCLKPFTERLQGVLPRRRTTQRYRRSLLWACETFADLKRVKKQYRCSNDFLYRALHEQLALKIKRNLYPWPRTIGIDEHSFQRRRTGNIPFVSILVDYPNKKIFELVDSKVSDRLTEKLAHIPGRENVQNAILDLADPYKKFIRNFFPNARMIADKFHVLRLLHPAINRRRKEITGDRRTLRIRRLLLMNASRLNYFDKADIHDFLNGHIELKQIWITKEKMHALYRCKGIDRARLALNNILKSLEHTLVPELQTLRRTLWKWSQEILNHFTTGLTNGRTEGFNNLAKLVKRRAFGYRSFENYRRRLLCAAY
jgi:transposase